MAPPGPRPRRPLIQRQGSKSYGTWNRSPNTAKRADQFPQRNSVPKPLRSPVFGQSTCQLPAGSPAGLHACVSAKGPALERRTNFPRCRPPRQKKKSRSTFLLIATCWPAEHGGRGGMAAGHHINVRSARGFREDRKISTLFPKSASANSGLLEARLAWAWLLKCSAGSMA